MPHAAPALTGTVTALYRYPVKGLSPEPLAEMPLAAGEGLAHDRAYALALGTTAFDPAAPLPLAKTNFLMLARNETLAALKTSVDTQTGRLTVMHGGTTPALSADLATPDGRAAIGRWFTTFAGAAACGDIQVVSAPGHRFTDVSPHGAALMNCVSMINLASLRALEAVMGRSLDMLRFRANIYVDGLPAWSELDLIGQVVTIGAASFRAVRRTRRCPATNVNPATAQRDADVPAALRANFGHADLGIYLATDISGTIAPGDTITAGG